MYFINLIKKNNNGLRGTGICAYFMVLGPNPTTINLLDKSVFLSKITNKRTTVAKGADKDYPGDSD